MFDVTPDEIALLNDTDLRELVGRLCEAELLNRRLSSDAVTWGGDQKATDGGVDVRVALRPHLTIDGFIPRPSTVFQVKTPDMPRKDILAEMLPKGAIRPVIQELANEVGAYIIVSSHASTSDSVLSNRKMAMREALVGLSNADQLETRFYDRTQVASWVRLHPGLITWVKERVGRALVGWRPYAPWSGAADGVEAEYLLDDRLRLDLGKFRDASAQSVADAIDELRDQLARPGQAVRLVGLSGVGKTRLVQALFDARVGARPLPTSLAVYTDHSESANPQPVGLASDLIANRLRAVLIIDNCASELHRRLANLCSEPGSTVSVLTVEYDVREDQPEGTQVVTLDTSSPELIEKLLKRRFPHLSRADARTIAEASGGNARLAIAIAETVDLSETVAGFSDNDLFQRLFNQRNAPNDALLLAAQVCSLLYSFQGEALNGEEAELPRLAVLANQAPQELYRHVNELRHRHLVQQHSVWRAVLPHAIANWLAARALDDIPYALIDKQIVVCGTDRLALSFSRRLSFLHAHPRAEEIVKGWLSPGGLLGDVTALNHFGRAMFKNVAPVLPEAALSALERVSREAPNRAVGVWHEYRSLLLSLAYDPLLFERSTSVLARAAVEPEGGRLAKEASNAFISLFTIVLSGTWATIEQRLDVIDRLLHAEESTQRSLGLAALEQVLKTAHFSSGHRFEFGARTRDYGYRPNTYADETRWYQAAMALIERLAITQGICGGELRCLLARSFRGLWTRQCTLNELERLSLSFSTEGFWREGWLACRETMRFNKDHLTPESLSRLSALEARLRPSSLQDRVRAVVLGNGLAVPDPEAIDFTEDDSGDYEQLEGIARGLGEAVAGDDRAFNNLLADLFQGGRRAWAFGQGLANASSDRRVAWAKLVEGLNRAPSGERDIQVLRGFLAELWEQDRDLANDFLDAALYHSSLGAFVPVLHSAVQLDERGVNRLKRALRSGQAPIWAYRNLALGRATKQLAGEYLKDLLLLIAEQQDGFGVAIEILATRLDEDPSASPEHESKVLEVGHALMQRIAFKRGDQLEDHYLAEVAKACLRGPEAGPIAAVAARRVNRSVAANETSEFDHGSLLQTLLSIQPMAVLDALFTSDGPQESVRAEVFNELSDHRMNSIDVISYKTLIEWCNRDQETRYPLAASIVTLACRPEENGPRVWSEQARAILANAPDPRSVLSVFIERFFRMGWAGSRAAQLESHARLLEDLPSEISAESLPFIVEARKELAKAVAREWQSETEQDRARDERFE